MVVDTTKCCKPSILCDIPLVRGDCVDIPLSEEVIVGVVALCLIPSCVRLIFVWLSVYPSKCRGDLCCALPHV